MQDNVTNNGLLSDEQLRPLVRECFNACMQIYKLSSETYSRIIHIWADTPSNANQEDMRFLLNCEKFCFDILTEIHSRIH